MNAAKQLALAAEALYACGFRGRAKKLRVVADELALTEAAFDGIRAQLSAVVAERDALAARLEGAEAVIEVQDVHARLVIAERDEAMRALGKLTAERDAEPDRIAEVTAERDALAAKVEDLECVLAGAGVCVECYANGWHKLDCSRRRTARALDGEARP